MPLSINSNEVLDTLKINFNNNELWAVNIILAIIMFGVALGITTNDFKRLFKHPKIVITGIISQFILFPFITFLLVYLINPYPSIALGMFMVAACPGGNISNFATHLAGGNTALSVSLTAFATLVAVVMTPFNLAFWGNLYEPTANILRSVKLDPFVLIRLVGLILGLPLLVGMLVRYYKPLIAHKLSKILRPLSIGILLLFVAGAFYENWVIFLEHIQYVFIIVITLNFAGYFSGFYFSKLVGLSYQDQKTLSIETGIQNSGLGLLLCFAFFEGLGGMALCLAFWSVWDIASCLGLAYFWSKKTTKVII